jgi:SAM domain (Sterile alpha motif)
MQEIAKWLKKLGMSEYAEKFAENDIDIAVLPDLTDQHLKDLGVSLGHRLKMLRAIRDLTGASVAATAPSAPVEPVTNMLRSMAPSGKPGAKLARRTQHKCGRHISQEMSDPTFPRTHFHLRQVASRKIPS